jgi:hypothetical protein
MKALYPFVGSTASQHKFNLKDPRDLDAAFRLRFFGDVTHSSNGVKGGGVNGYFDTFLNPSTLFSSLTGGSQFIYVRNNTDTGTDLAAFEAFVNYRFQLASRNTNLFVGAGFSNGLYTTSNTDSRGFYGVTRPPSSSTYNAILNTNSFSVTDAYQEPNSTIYGLALPFSGSPLAGTYSDHELSFVCVADGLTTTEAQTLRTINLAFQTTLGRSIGTQTVSDADAQAFVTAANIVDQVEANAINNLVIGMKADGLWTKMKAVYPFVGGTASSNKFNLKNPLDTDAAFRLVFSGGWTHSTTGALPNGTNAYADTKLLPDSNSLYQNCALSYYSRTNTAVDGSDIGAYGNAANLFKSYNIQLRTAANNYSRSAMHDGSNTLDWAFATNIDSRGYYIANRTSGTVNKIIKNGAILNTNTTSVNLFSQTTQSSIYIGAANLFGTGAMQYANRQCAFASIGDGLTDTDATNLNSRVTTFQTTLNRNI